MPLIDPLDDTDPRTRTLPQRVVDRLKAAANPDCVTCEGEGFVSMCSSNDPDREEDVVCPCVDDDAAWRTR